MSFDSTSTGGVGGGVFPKRALTIGDETHNQLITVYLHSFNPEKQSQKVRLDLHKRSTTEELIDKIINDDAFEDKGGKVDDYEVFETMGTLDGRTYKERKLDCGEYPVAVQDLWVRTLSAEDDTSVPRNRFVLRKKGSRPMPGLGGQPEGSSTIDEFLVKFMQQPVDREYADLCMLPELTEQTLLDNLRARFHNGHIYTYIGPILVAVNPFKFFPIYNPKYARLYCQSRRLGALPPHIFAIADVTYHNMLRIKQNQCVVISGESGSGKTESTNFLLHHLTTLSQKGSNGSSIEQMLLSAGPVLEAFGNAVTLQNNNSSRFGKFIKVNYRENGMVSGANVEIYLLEKSRIISQASGERNYHVFYYLLEGASEEEKKKHSLLNINDYTYLSKNKLFDKAEVYNESYEFDRLKHAMDAVGFSRASQQSMFGILSAVLLLGNINFIKRPGYHSDEAAYVENEATIDLLASLLLIKPNQLTQALTMKRTVLKHDTVISRYHVAEAINTRDAMAKCLYNTLFHWIVLRMNQALIGRDVSNKKGFYIGILDIFGFEDIGSQWNSFEQLCINYANEHLQAYFNQHIFQFEQEEYFKEGISWTSIEYTDNTECVQLFQSKPYGLLRLIDEESNINNGTDRSMLEKLNTFLKNNEYYEVPHKREDAFIIAHYAGKVKYQVTGFREKNKDLMRQDVMTVMKSSNSAFLKEIIADDAVAFFRWSVLRATFRAMSAFKSAIRSNGQLRRAESVDRLLVPNAPLKQSPRRGSDSHLNAFLRGDLSIGVVPDFCDTSVFKTIVSRAKKITTKPREERQTAVKSLQAAKELMGKKQITNKPTSVSRQFDYSLSRLMKILGQATPYFIRCIKSNNEKNPNSFDDNIILRQLRYTGMLETVRIRRAGYSVRIEYEAFVQQYRVMLAKGRESEKEDIKEFIKNHPVIDADNFQYGTNKIFMRDAEKLLLDDHLHRVIMEHIGTLQCWFRAVLARKRYLRLRVGIVRMQAWVRGIHARNHIRRLQAATTLLQSWWRRVRAERRYRSLRRAALAIQAWCRAAAVRRQLPALRERHLARCGQKKRLSIDIDKVRTIDLPHFNLGDPKSLAQFGKGEDELMDDDSFSAEDEEPESTDKWDSSDIDLDATFVLENTRLKLIGESDKGFQRRQSLATTASSAKLRMLRRAASTESDQIQRELMDKIQSPSSKLKFHKIGFTKAKKHLKALLTRKPEDEDDLHSSLSPSADSGKNAKLVHVLKMTRIHKANDSCSLCNKSISSLLVQGYKCAVCKLSFHKECSTFATNIPCIPLSPIRDLSKHSVDYSKKFPSPFSSTFSLTKTKQQTDPAALLIESVEDLRQFSVFIFKKQCQLEQEKKRDTVVDAIFKKSLREFHMELIGCEAVLTEDRTILRYRDLISTFEGLLTKLCTLENITFPTTLGVNAFRGFLNEFMQQQSKRRGSNKKTNIIKTVRKKRRRSDVTLLNGHRFRPDFVHVPTYCEVCNQFMWHAEKICICVNCRLSCHKKCHTKVSERCTKSSLAAHIGKGCFFGADLGVLVGEELVAPPIVNNMFMSIEVKALFVEGIYRKSGSLAAVKSVRRQIDECPDINQMDFNDIPVHVLTTIIKAFFRELREPLITYELYENFIHVSEVKETAERLRCLSVVVDLLPKHNKVILDRLMYHLARVAHQHTVNKMNASNLAVIFAPCILRRNQAVHAQEQLEDVQKQAVCVQILIEEKLRQYKESLNQIVELEEASEKVSENLRLIEEHRRNSTVEAAEPLNEVAESQTPHHEKTASAESQPNIETARQLFEEQLEFLDQEKSKLIQELPPLAPVASSEDLTSSEADQQQLRQNSASPSIWSSGDLLVDEYAIDMEEPPVLNRLPSLFRKHARPRPCPQRRPPTIPLPSD